TPKFGLSHRRAPQGTEDKKQAAALCDLRDLRWPGLAPLHILARRSYSDRVQSPLQAADVRAPRTSPKNTDSHSRAKSPLAPPAARKAFSALSLIAFSLARRYFFLALSTRSAFSACRIANSSRMAAISARRASKAVSGGTDVSRATACVMSSAPTGLMR